MTNADGELVQGDGVAKDAGPLIPKYTDVVDTKSDEEYDYDIVIVGGGISGSSVLYHLSRSGARVLLLEQWEAPKEDLQDTSFASSGANAKKH